jgi:hypothetical protein
MEKEEANKVLLHSVLYELGFREVNNAMVFDFENCKLSAIYGLTPNFFLGYSFMGFWRTSRSMGEIIFHLPEEFATFDEAIAFIAYYLRTAELKYQPEWLIKGLTLKHLLPWEKERELWRKEQEAYENNPKVEIEHEWFRLIVKKILLIAEISEEDNKTTFSFDGSVFKIDCNNKIIACPAEGQAWEKSVTIKTKLLKHLPKRISKQNIFIHIWKEKFCIGSNRFEMLE